MIVNVFVKKTNTIEDKLNMKKLLNIKSLMRYALPLKKELSIKHY